MTMAHRMVRAGATGALAFACAGLVTLAWNWIGRGTAAPAWDTAARLGVVLGVISRGTDLNRRGGRPTPW
jgi:hypothetical protein